MSILRRIEGTGNKKCRYKYETHDKRILVMYLESRTEWVATLRSKVTTEDDSAYMVAVGSTLAQCTRRLEHYLNDEAGLALRTRHHYGFMLDQRPVAREDKPDSK